VTSRQGSRSERLVQHAPPELFFVFSAVAQYVGAVIAINLFDELAPATVAWLRVLFAGIIIMAFQWKHLHPRWTRKELQIAAVFGITTALMNMFFYMAIDRLPLGKGVTIEFIGPIAVAALQTRSVRNTIALLFAAIGVIVLGGVEIGNEPLGLVFILLASFFWAGYIVIGSRVALANRGTAGLGIGLLIGGLVITPFASGSAEAAFTTPHLLLGCAVVGLLANAIGYGIDQATMRRIPIRRFSVMAALLPVVAGCVGFIFLDQTPTFIDLLGMALVLIGVASQERERIERHHPEPQTT
jgi:inner membrane transporter RhtA